MLYIDKSSIHGLGLYSDTDIPDGYAIENVIPLTAGNSYYLRLDRNIFAKKINHSDSPNCEMYFHEDGIWLYANQDIHVGEELTYHYMDDERKHDNVGKYQELIEKMAHDLKVAILIF